MPGIVQSYDPITKTADVLPAIKRPVYDPETGDADGHETLPVIAGVPVSFPRGGGWHLSFPLEKGDHVTLIFSEVATGQWRASGELSEPVDVRRHSLGYPVAIPGAHADPDVLADDANPLFTGMLVLGKDGDPTQSIRIGPTGVECGGALPLPLAMGVQTAAGLAGGATGATANAAVFTALAALFTGLAISNPGDAVAYNVAAAACTTAASAATTMAATVTAAVAGVPALITKGQ
jgi:hypothetical protein